jgi:two-component system, chemotaxis family, chemotaxis protein CheY
VWYRQRTALVPHCGAFRLETIRLRLTGTERSSDVTRERTVLVVDDDQDIRDSIADVLLAKGFRVKSAANGLEALRLLRDQAERPNLILLDILMPVMDAWAFRAEQRKMPPDIAGIPVVLISAYSLPHREATFDEAGYLRKPFEVNALLETVERVAPAHSAGLGS